MNTEVLTLKVGGELAVTVSVSEKGSSSGAGGKQELATTWEEDFRTWKELQDSEELASLLKKAEETLTGGPGGKGWAKGTWQ